MSRTVGITVLKPNGQSISRSFTYLDKLQRWEVESATGVSLTDRNLSVTSNGTGFLYVGGARGLIGGARTFGKYYYEITWATIPVNGSNGGIAVAPFNADYLDLTVDLFTPAQDGVVVDIQSQISAYGQFPNFYLTSGVPSYGFQQDDVVGVAIDLDNQAVWFKIVFGPSIGVDWNGGNGADPSK